MLAVRIPALVVWRHFLNIQPPGRFLRKIHIAPVRAQRRRTGERKIAAKSSSQRVSPLCWFTARQVDKLKKLGLLEDGLMHTTTGREYVTRVRSRDDLTFIFPLTQLS